MKKKEWPEYEGKTECHRMGISGSGYNTYYIIQLISNDKCLDYIIPDRDRHKYEVLWFFKLYKMFTG